MNRRILRKESVLVSFGRAECGCVLELERGWLINESVVGVMRDALMIVLTTMMMMLMLLVLKMMEIGSLFINQLVMLFFLS